MTLHDPTTSPHLHVARQARSAGRGNEAFGFNLAAPIPEASDHTLTCQRCGKHFEVRIPRMVSALATITAWQDHADGLCRECWQEKQKGVAK